MCILWAQKVGLKRSRRMWRGRKRNHSKIDHSPGQSWPCKSSRWPCKIAKDLWATLPSRTPSDPMEFSVDELRSLNLKQKNLQKLLPLYLNKALHLVLPAVQEVQGVSLVKYTSQRQKGLLWLIECQLNSHFNQWRFKLFKSREKSQDSSQVQIWRSCKNSEKFS